MNAYINNMKYSSLFLALLFLAFSCQDPLDTSPRGVIAEGVLNGETVDKLVVAAYQGLGAHYFGNDEAFTGPASNWVIDVRSDDAWKGGGGIADRSDIHQLEIATLDATSIPAFNKWRNTVFSIARTNLAISEIQALDEPAYPRVIRTAEMRFLRGHFHFDLKRNYNQIPYLDEEADPLTTSNTKLTNEEQWAMIEADLQFAFDNLPASQDQIGRVNKYVAAAYLAKLYIETAQWDKAVPMADFVINSGEYSLLPEFSDLSTLEFESGPESVFTIQYSTASIFANHDWSNLLNVTRSPGIDAGGYANGDDFYLASQNLVNAFRTDEDGLPLFDAFDDEDVEDGFYNDNLDPRLDYTVGRLGIPWKGTAIYTDAWVRGQDYFPGYSCKKHVVSPDEPSIHTSFPWAASGLNFNLIRYAEVLLWKAKALIELNQELDVARDLINQVRERAMLSTPVQNLDGSGDAANYNIGLYPAAGWNQSYARQAVRFERRLELAMEGKRFYDLNRWGITAEVINDYFSTESEDAEYLNGAQFVGGTHEYLPIPQNELDIQPGLYQQNNGY